MASKVYVESLESRVLLSAAMAPLVAAPSLSVQGHGLVIAKGDAVPSRQDFTDFGPMSTSGGAATRRYVIKNKGLATLNISALKVAGLNPGDYTITSAPISNIAPGAQAAVVIRFSPLAAGASTAKVVIVSNDPSNRRDTFAIKGQGLTTTNLPDGLQYATTVAGTGRLVTVNTLVAVNYTGYLLNGVQFDTSLGAGRSPLQFMIVDGSDPLKRPQVIKGWNEGLQGMRRGEHRTFFIPPSLAYGATGSGTAIPANATLVFETELVWASPFPYLSVLGKRNTVIPYGSLTPMVSNGTDFGTTTKGQSVSRTFILKTTDVHNEYLKLYTINFNSQAGQFNWSVDAYDTTVGGWPLKITYKAAKVGIVNTTVVIPSNDPHHPFYTFAIHAKTIA